MFKSFNPSRRKLTPGKDKRGEKFKLCLHLYLSVTVAKELILVILLRLSLGINMSPLSK